MDIVVGYALVILWLFLPMVKIAKSSHSSGVRKFLWIAGTFAPFAVVLLCTKVIQALAPTYTWASVIINSTIGVLILIMTFLVGGWAVLALYDYVHKQ